MQEEACLEGTGKKFVRVLQVKLPPLGQFYVMNLLEAKWGDIILSLLSDPLSNCHNMREEVFFKVSEEK